MESKLEYIKITEILWGEMGFMVVKISSSFEYWVKCHLTVFSKDSLSFLGSVDISMSIFNETGLKLSLNQTVLAG